MPRLPNRTNADFRSEVPAELRATKQVANPVRGQSVAFELTPTSKLADRFYTIARAEDARVTCWQISLGPITIASLRGDVDGMPAHRAPISNATGAPVVRMTWGGGGVSFRTSFNYPANGASFAVSGDNVMVEVRPTDRTTTFSAATAPALTGWVAPLSVPTSVQPLVEWFAPAASPAANPLQPWVKALWFTRDTVAATALVTFNGPAGIVAQAQLTAADSAIRIAVPAQATSYVVAPSAGLVYVGQELAFT